jgi:hypothetical protein
MRLNEMIIKADEYDLFHILSGAEKLEFMLNALDMGPEESMIKQISKSDIMRPDPMYQQEDLQVGVHRLLISAYDDIIVLNSDSLKVLRAFTRKIFRDGHLLIHNTDVTKDRDIDIYRYFKAFNVIKLDMPICEN